MRVNFVKDADGKTLAVQIPIAEYERIEPVLRLMESDSDREPFPELPTSGADLTAFFQLRDMELENKLPDLKKFMAEDREERI